MQIEIRVLKINGPDKFRSVMQYREAYYAPWLKVQEMEGCEHEKAMDEYCEPCGRIHSE